MSKISIIVPVYKVEPYLDTCIRSLICQTYQNTEIILIDDGSPDNCGLLCDQYMKRDSRIKVIHKENGGLSRARNTGLDAATGDYICFVDSDDLVQPNYCEELLDALINSECDFSVCAVHRFEDGTTSFPHSGNIPVRIISNHNFLQMQLDHKSEFGVWNKLFPRAVMDHLRFMDGKIHEDVIFSADLAKSLHNGVACVGSELYLYRQRSNGIVSSHTNQCSPDRIFAGEYLLDAVRTTYPDLLQKALKYALDYPWMFVDPIYVHHAFKDNKIFLDSIQSYLRRYLNDYESHYVFPKLQLHRMKLFSRSRFLYGINAYSRLFRVYLYRLIGKDAYLDGHGI